MLSPRAVVCGFIAALLDPAGAALAQAAPLPPLRADVPVRSVVLYSSGVGYFEHAGTVRGTGSTEIRFKTEQINDVLKSLVLQDADGGRVNAITYPSRDPVAKTLKSFQVDITANPGLADLLNQVRGARVTVHAGAEPLRGTILGVEVRRVPTERGEFVQSPMLNMLTGAMIRSVDLKAVRSLSLDDPKLEDELSRALVALTQSRDQDKKPVSISYSGTGERHLKIGYVVEAPVWKTSYRLLLDSSKARLQGWAIVENQTESDWNDVALTLVSGKPLSFKMDLYQPLYASRPTETQAVTLPPRPQIYTPGVNRLSEVVVTGSGETRKVQLANSAAALHAVVVGRKYVEFPELVADETVQATAKTSTLGELFQYAVPNVSLARQKSAMLPIVTDSVRVQRVSIFNPAVLAANPLYGVRLHNITGKHLLQGPVTVLDGDRYVGDARIDDIPPGQDRFLSYGVDLALQMGQTRSSDTLIVTSARIGRGVIYVEKRRLETREYLVENKGDKEKTLVIEHPARAGWRIIEGPKVLETTPTVHRLAAQIVPGKLSIVRVREQRVETERMGVAAGDLNTLISYNAIGSIPLSVREELAKAIRMKTEIDSLEQQIEARTTSITQIEEEQSRLRENMKTVQQKSAYYKRLLAKLNDQETSIERQRRESDDIEARVKVLLEAMYRYLEGVTVR